ncbi:MULTISPECIES: antibiotic biosynthesis monooxygenase family protein [unclassified Bradyrhizobium]|uniref:putative quinol monooxygenase n=2 Tax=Bradyrhizobium TaxID=374 RepID=UPI00289E05DC|nr:MULTISPECIES: antibiotic biosynthesis monooxygenase family protein [unclassified Bradyrhizobium]
MIGAGRCRRIESFRGFRTPSSYDNSIDVEALSRNPCHDDRSRRIEPALHSQENNMAAIDNANQSLVVTAFWEVNPGEEAAVANLLKDFLPQAQREPGVKEFQIHQNLAEPRKYFFYEVFAGEAAFADHQQTPHFKNIIQGQAIPKLAKRERSQFRFI